MMSTSEIATNLYSNLRSYQKEDVDKILDFFKSDSNHSVLRQIYTGCGKSVEQTYLSFNWLAADEKNIVLFLVHRKELIDNAEDYYKRLGVSYCVIKAGRKNLWNRRIFLGSIDTIRSDKNLNAFSEHLKKVDGKLLIIGDEFHRSEASTYQKVLNYFENKKLIGFTATPARSDGKGFDTTYQKLIKTQYNYNWFIQNKFLSEFEVVRPKQLIDNSIKVVRGDYSLEEQKEYYEEHPEIFGDIVECYEKFCWYSRCNLIGKEKEFSMLKNIVFAPDLLTSQNIVDKYNEWSQSLLGRDIAVHLDGNTPDDIRQESLKRFSLPSDDPNSIIIISNFALFLEGYNLPSLSVTQWLRKSKSVIVVCQGNGRSCRFEDGKIQWILDHVGNTLEHGNPNEEREFSLKGKLKKPKDYSIVCPNCEKVLTDNYVRFRLEARLLSKITKKKIPSSIICECGTEVYLPTVTEQERKEREKIQMLSDVEWEVGTSEEIKMYMKFKKYETLPPKTFLQKLVLEGMQLDNLLVACNYRKISNEYASTVWMEHVNKQIRKELFSK